MPKSDQNLDDEETVSAMSSRLNTVTVLKVYRRMQFIPGLHGLIDERGVLRTHARHVCRRLAGSI